MQDTAFYPKGTLNCRGRLLDLSEPVVMGILNVTPDSFYDGERYLDLAKARRQIRKMLNDGARIIDIGANSSRPGAKYVSARTEWRRIDGLINDLSSRFPEAIISVDTFYADVAKRALDAGAHIINDISAGNGDKNMHKVIADYSAPYVMMHMKGVSKNMQKNPRYKNVTKEVLSFLQKKLISLRKKGINDIVIDPGFGFGKTVEHNYTLLRELNNFSQLGCPILAGVSRKSMICKVLEVNPDKALTGTIAANTMALMKGASILRVHDVKEAVETIKIHKAYKGPS